MKKVLLDKDVLIDLLSKNDPAYKPVAKVLSNSKKLKLKVFLCNHTLHELISYVVDKKGEHEAKEMVRLLLQLVRIISPAEKTFHRALEATNPEFSRALFFQVAEDNHIDFIISNKIKSSKDMKLPVISAEQLLSSL
jgi:predicted nucleic acid-binding protein